ncbi:MAG: PSD1 and planctomycete cytochrome C domain-containing protein [Planctomycetota bacterium]|nr:PSD1 and planctomycete cytochrome C domain-containing protein [Planctomycetota bacterium]
MFGNGRYCVFLLVLHLGFWLGSVGYAEEPPVDFNRDIRPILSDNCYACHGPDENQRQADLRLDLEAETLADRGGYFAIVPGKPAASELLQRVLSSDPDSVMPPADHRKKLTDSDKQLLRRWIEEGAKWQQHWAWSPRQPSNFSAESVSKEHYIDQKIEEQLRESGLQPSPTAERIVLLRRLYFDLIGLPPTPQQVDAFLADRSSESYENQVEQLLASPHYGERMAIFWLDQVRYADTVGYHGDQDMSVSPYRDYVIESFNKNRPFDQFTREQIAGDLLPNPTLEQQIASGYNRLGMMSAEGGVQPEEYLTKYAADRVRTTASVWLGVTLGCAECHDHKFDPFTAKDFYSFAAFFADIKEKGLYAGANTTGLWGPQIEVPDDQLAALIAPVARQIAERKEQMQRQKASLVSEQVAWEKNLRSQVVPWEQRRPIDVRTYHQTDHQVLDDGSVLMTGPVTDEDCYLVTLELPAGAHHGLRLEALPDKTLPQQGPGRAGNGNFVVTQLRAVRGDHRERMEDLKKVVNLWPEELTKADLELVKPTATFEQLDNGANPYKKWSAVSAIDRDKHGPTYGWAVMPESGKENEWVAQFSEPLELVEPEKITLVLHQYHGAGNHILGKFRFSTTASEEAKADPFKSLPAEVKSLVGMDQANRTAAQNQTVAEYYFSIAPQLAPLRQQIAELEKQSDEITKAHTRTSLVTVAVPPREMRVLPRGNWMDKSGEVVVPQIPALFGALPIDGDRRLNRLDLANWIVADDNPLTARVFVNRLWKMYFGTGLSKVLDDLGAQGEAPSHPELLDMLADDFVESGWDIKAMVRRIVNSQTYRQASAERTDLEEVDPYNRLLARQSRYRLEAELIRDNALAVSGILVTEIGGRSAKPYQPAGLYRHLNFPVRTYQADQGNNQFRRGLYTHWQRQFLHPAMKAFDAPSREECTCERPRSNTPVGALVLLNDPSFVESARKLAELTMRSEAEGAADRTEIMFRRVLSRPPSAAEREILVGLFQDHWKHYQAEPEQAEQVVKTGISEVPTDLAKPELAAWTSVARTLLNLHEFVTRN